MKTKLLFICFLIGGIGSVNAQNMNWSNGNITFSDRSGNPSQHNSVEYGAFTSFKIDDINLFLYSVTIAGNRIDLETPIPTELQTLFRLPSTQLAATGSVEEVKTAIAATETEARRVTILTEGVKRENAEAMLFNKNKKRNQSLKSVNAELESALTNFDDKMKDFLAKANIVSTNIEEIKLARIKLVNLAQKDITFSQMTAAVQGVTQPANPSQNYQNLLTANKALQAAYDAMAATGEDVTELDKAMEKAKKALKVIQDENPATLYADVDFLSTELANKKNFTAIAPPVQGDGDFVNYNVAVTPSRTNTLGAYKSPVNFDFDIPVRGGWKTDFSVGPTFSFGSGAKDEKYYFEESATEGNVILKERENNNVVSPGLAAMMHFYKRSGKDWSWGGMMGVGAGFQSFDDADISFYTGLSAILGKSQKVMISAGLSFLNVERLKENEYSVDKEYANTVALNDVTEKVIKSSFFISLSYNLTNRVER